MVINEKYFFECIFHYPIKPNVSGPLYKNSIKK
jgi:hypothetical protein